MENFNFCIGTNIVFGKDEIVQLPALVKPLGSKVLLTYGGGSIKRIGLYDRVKELLADCEVYEQGGIIHYAPIALVEPDNYEARAQIFLASNIADNATLCNGNGLCVWGSCYGA